jgi:hypothetical protein
MSEHYDSIPDELKQVRQWCISGPDKAPYHVNAGGVHHASIHSPSSWTDFATVRQNQIACGSPGIGFVLSVSDPWTCIDIDICNAETQRLKGKPIDSALWTTAEQVARYQSIVDTFDSYTEISTLGWGLHIWVRGFVGSGVKRDGVEIYSQERFMICTGNVYRNRPIVDRQDLLDNMVSQMRGSGHQGPTVLVELDEVESDVTVYERASTAENADKFNSLASGDWTSSYSSQSEADLALLSMLCFYSKSNEQCRRLFRCTVLGQREKANKNDKYLNFTLEIIRGRQQRESIVDEDSVRKAYELVRQIQGVDYGDVAAAQLAASLVVAPESGNDLPWPPGMLGALASYIYSSAIRPVREVAIVAALGWLAGVCGKAFNIPQSGLNMYIVLVAQSGIGKEAMHTGLSLVQQHLQRAVPGAQNFVDFTEFVSSPALMKTIAVNPSFVNVSGEFGKRLKRFADDGDGDKPMGQLRTTMTHLYQKSGAGNMVGGLSYSDKEKNVTSMTAVAYSLIGESTPETFYQALTSVMMEDGFLSRFLIVDYKGDRPPRNKNPTTEMTPSLLQALGAIVSHSMTMISKFEVEMVSYDDESLAIADAFDLECDGNINDTSAESVRQMWNRAHLKVCRIAALMACGDACYQPVIRAIHMNWALDIVRRDIAIMSSRMESGDIGVDDGARLRKAVALLREYVSLGPRDSAYGQPDGLSKANVISKRFLHGRLSQCSQFKNTRDGQTRAIDTALKSLCENGYLSLVDKTELVTKYSFHGIAYRIIALPPLK